MGGTVQATSAGMGQGSEFIVRLPLATLTGWGQEEDRLRARVAGFDRHFVKPIDVDVLRAWLASLDAA